MTNIVDVIIAAGLVPDNVVEQARRWGTHPSGEDLDIDCARTLLDGIREVIESREYVMFPETDLDLLRLHAKAHKDGKLVLIDDGRREVASVSYVVTALGEYAVPWADDHVPAAITNGESYLQTEDARVRFSTGRLSMYGDSVMFMVCTPVEAP